VGSKALANLLGHRFRRDPEMPEGRPEAVLVVDDTALVKQGKPSVHGKRVAVAGLHQGLYRLSGRRSSVVLAIPGCLLGLGEVHGWPQSDMPWPPCRTSCSILITNDELKNRTCWRYSNDNIITLDKIDYDCLLHDRFARIRRKAPNGAVGGNAVRFECCVAASAYVKKYHAAPLHRHAFEPG
jgi:hypothetical protein